MSKILITAGKSLLATKLTNLLLVDELILADYGEMPSIKVANSTFKNLDKYRKDALAHNLLSKCLDWGVDILIPLYAEELMSLAKSLLLFEEYDIKVICPTAEQIAKYLRAHDSINDFFVLEHGALIYGKSNELNTENNLTGVFSINDKQELVLVSQYYKA